jgi:hypothetical protein
MPPRTRAPRKTIDTAFARELAALKAQTLREIEKESQKLITQLQQQIATTLQEQLSRSLIAAPTSNATFNATPSPLGRLSSILGSTLRLNFSKPSRSTSAQETERSQQAQSQFRLSRSQQMAELTRALGKGESNL